jgi:hypothetical protein
LFKNGSIFPEDPVHDRRVIDPVYAVNVIYIERKADSCVGKPVTKRSAVTPRQLRRDGNAFTHDESSTSVQKKIIIKEKRGCVRVNTAAARKTRTEYYARRFFFFFFFCLGPVSTKTEGCRKVVKKSTEGGRCDRVPYIVVGTDERLANKFFGMWIRARVRPRLFYFVFQ